MLIVIVRFAIQLAGKKQKKKNKQMYRSRMKHIDVGFYFIGETLDGGNILLKKIGIAKNLVNTLFKMVYGVKF